ncbi:MAG: ATP-binding protein [Candidatus Aminicenantes bacterium]|uniref:Bipolar DNA helicase HerA n=1 Tax=Candidatus Saccharicenans subterraneus TaxID=2508984 RepID=A0A3E2BK62_9BACT|nr:ATP-binding protein [Candidatus Aminicenantes bacterium]RFT15121.1 MAG: Bipolar DNA helicase HerA [Candidatus Saccharicenans subterraneum]
MATDFEIGRVVAVDTAQVTIELNRDLKGMSRITYEGPQEVGRINSYVIIPVGARRLVAMVTRIVLVEEAEMKADRTMVALPAARRLMKATLIGTIDGSVFRQGVSLFPVLDSPVHLAGRSDLDAIFGPVEQAGDKNPDSDKPGCCIPIGESVVMQGRPIRIDPDAFFGKHAAILGSTGSGKSCTIASLIQAIHEQQAVKRTTFVILDTNGEYRTAFQKQKEDGTWEEAATRRTLFIPSDPSITADRLVIPYWFMNAEDFVRLFQASKGVQRPVLLEALRISRNEADAVSQLALLREELIHEFNRIWSLSGKDERTSRDVRDLAEGLKRRIDQDDLTEAWTEAMGTYKITKEDVDNALSKIIENATKFIDDNKFPKVLPADARKAIQDAMDPIYQKLTGAHIGEGGGSSGRSADAPFHFDKLKFRSLYLEQVLRREESGGARARDYCGTMLLRIDRLLADRRFDFLFGPVGEALPKPSHALATFLRDILGIGPAAEANIKLTSEADLPKGVLPFYDRQRNKESAFDVVILDLSLLATEVLENVTALIGRLILEFLQRLGEHGGEGARGSFPVVLVLEEAQNYIQQPRSSEDESISRTVFERIAREGRKYGLSLVVASQRPSELSKTVLSQCNSFIVHRLQNPEDLRYFKEIVPGIYGPMLEQIPALAPQTALVLGECVPAPALVRIREARPVPRSRDPKFYRYWVADQAPSIDVEAICILWEGTKDADNKEEAK